MWFALFRSLWTNRAFFLSLILYCVLHRRCMECVAKMKFFPIFMAKLEPSSIEHQRHPSWSYFVDVHGLCCGVRISIRNCFVRKGRKCVPYAIEYIIRKNQKEQQHFTSPHTPAIYWNVIFPYWNYDCGSYVCRCKIFYLKHCYFTGDCIFI